MERIDDRLDLINSLALCVSQFLDVLFFSGNELMKRRIQETDRNGLPSRASYSFSKSPCCSGRIFLQSCFSLFYCLRADHLTNASILLPSKNICSVRHRPIPSAPSSRAFLASAGVSRVCTNLHGSVFVSPCHDSSEFAGDGSVYSGDDSVVDVTCCTVDGDRISIRGILYLQG